VTAIAGAVAAKKDGNGFLAVTREEEALQVFVLVALTPE
jgi:hypothetical protein